MSSINFCLINFLFYSECINTCRKPAIRTYTIFTAYNHISYVPYMCVIYSYLKWLLE